MTGLDQVTAWLAQEGVPFEEAPLPDADDYGWALVIQPQQQFAAFIAARKRDWSDLAIEITLTVSDNHKELLRRLDADARDRFVFDLRIALLEKPVGFLLRFEDDDESILQAAAIGYRIFEDPLTKAGFFRRHHQVQSAALLAATFFAKLERFRAW